jgi:ATP-binding cassette subfamily B protein RaxB
MGVADQLGFMPRAVKLPLEKLQNLHLPCILHWDMSHFVVLEKVAGKKALIHNPDGRSSWLSLKTVSDYFTGIALELRLSSEFKPGNHRKVFKARELWQKIGGIKRAIIQVLALSVALELFIVISPYYLQIAVDNVIPALDGNLLTVLGVGFGLFTLINCVATLLRSFVLLAAGTVVGYSISANIGRHLFRLPIDWFSKRHSGDILSRFQSVTPIQNALTQGAVLSIIDGILAAITLSVMFFYSLSLSLIALLAFSSYTAVRILTFSFLRRAQEEAIVAHSKEQSTLIETIQGMPTLRIFGLEMMRHAYWQTRLMDAANADVGVARINNWQYAANSLIFGLENIITIWLAIRFIIEGGGFSLGMLFAYLSYKTQFIQKSSSLIDQIIAFNILGLHLERLSDILLSPQDKNLSNDTGSGLELKGKIELRNIKFRHNQSEAFLLDDVNLVIPEGTQVALTGPSGCGKTTLAKLILGLIDPEEGSLIVDGLPINRFGLQNYRRQVAAVLQEDAVFSGTIIDNIALFEENPILDDVIDSAKKAAIHEYINDLPMKYETFIGDRGSILSGGQKQRILLARALYRNPKLLVLDESTSHLDVANEAIIQRSLTSLGITIFVIAHRPETIALADTVYVMTKGNDVLRIRGDPQI